MTVTCGIRFGVPTVNCLNETHNKPSLFDILERRMKFNRCVGRMASLLSVRIVEDQADLSFRSGVISAHIGEAGGR